MPADKVTEFSTIPDLSSSHTDVWFVNTEGVEGVGEREREREREGERERETDNRQTDRGIFSSLSLSLIFCLFICSFYS